jgi:hypothetical protein
MAAVHAGWGGLSFTSGRRLSTYSDLAAVAGLTSGIGCPRLPAPEMADSVRVGDRGATA